MSVRTLEGCVEDNIPRAGTVNALRAPASSFGERLTPIRRGGVSFVAQLQDDDDACEKEGDAVRDHDGQ